MAHYRKQSTGWTAEIDKLGVRESKTFPTKAEALAWATHREGELLSGKRGGFPKKTVSDALKDYAIKVSPKKKGARWELVRLLKFGRDLACRDKIISEVTATDIAEWRDARLKCVKESSVRREWNLLHNVFKIARAEWKWLKEMPFAEVKTPRNGKPRVRRIAPHEHDALMAALGYREGAPIKTKQQRVALAFELAVESGMRTGEMCGLLDAEVIGDVAYLDNTKNDDARPVPLSPRAMTLIAALRAARPANAAALDPLLGVSAASVDTLYRKGRARAAKLVPSIRTLWFHDTRHEACTRLARVFNLMELAAVIGHRDLDSLQIYYNPTPQELSARFTSAPGH